MQFHGTSYSRPEFLYFWVYYVGFNAPWAIVPLGIIYVTALRAAQYANPSSLKAYCMTVIHKCKRLLPPCVRQMTRPRAFEPHTKVTGNMHVQQPVQSLSVPLTQEINQMRQTSPGGSGLAGYVIIG
jgi:hypothetical protein